MPKTSKNRLNWIKKFVPGLREVGKAKKEKKKRKAKELSGADPMDAGVGGIVEQDDQEAAALSLLTQSTELLHVTKIQIQNVLCLCTSLIRTEKANISPKTQNDLAPLFPSQHDNFFDQFDMDLPGVTTPVESSAAPTPAEPKRRKKKEQSPQDPQLRFWKIIEIVFAHRLLI